MNLSKNIRDMTPAKENDSSLVDKIVGKNDTPIIAEKSINPLKELVNSVEKTNLINVLLYDLKDPLQKYKEDDAISVTKVPQSIYIVAIIHKLIEVAKEINLGICVKHGVIFVYTGKYWKEVNDDEFKKVLSDIAIKMGYYSPASAKTSDFKKKLFVQLMDAGIEEAITSNQKNKIFINLKNGTLEIDAHNVKLREHNRDDFLTYVLNYNYDEKAESPIFSKFMNEVLPHKETQNILQEFTGYIFTSNLKLEKVAVLYGTGANGKSVFFEVITKMIGNNNLSFKGLGDICMKGDKGHNHRAELENKLINYASEINPQGADLEIFKALVSGEPTSARRLYKDVYTFKNEAKLIFNANKLPAETERTHGFFRRFLIIPFDVTINEKDKDIELHNKIIKSELAGVLNWSIIGLKRLLINKDFTKSDEVEKALEAYKKETNSVALFIDEEDYISNINGTFSINILYDNYKGWVYDAGMHKLSKTNFSKELERLGYERYRTEKERGFRIVKRG